MSRTTIRVYRAKGLLPEPDRDASGYRRHTARDVIEVLKIRTLAQAGVLLAHIRELRSATDDEFQQALSLNHRSAAWGEVGFVGSGG